MPKNFRQLSFWPSAFVALLAGAAITLAYAPFYVWPLSLISPAIILWFWLKRPPRQAALLGLIFGFGMFGAGTSWVFVSIHEFGRVPLVPAVALTLLLITVLALFPALVGGVVARLRGGEVWQDLLLAAAIWVLAEWIRGWLMTGFPWLLLGYAHTDSPLAGWVPVLGVYGVSLLTMTSVAALVLSVKSGRRRRIQLLSLVAAIWVSGGLLTLVDWTESAGTPFTAALIQGNVSQDQKWRPDQLEPTKKRYRELTQKVPNAKVVVWPESAIPRFFEDAASYFVEVTNEARARGQELVIGVLHTDLISGAYYNSLMTMTPAPQFYAKRHLVPFTEYLPLQWLLGDFVRFMEFPVSDFSRGSDNQALLSAGGYPFAGGICYEDAFGEELIDQLPEARYLVNVSNDAWFGRSIAPHQHLQIARMRSLETGRFMLRATNTGVTAIIDHRGQVTAQAPQFETTALQGDVQPRAGATPYVRWGNGAMLVLVAIMLGLGFHLRRSALGAKSAQESRRHRRA